jgi:hypothetical protein
MGEARRRQSEAHHNISNEHGAPIVTFAYVDAADAVKAREQIKKAISDAALIVAPRGRRLCASAE